MSNLVLELRANDLMIVNGAALRFRTKSSIELTTHARFMFGKQIMQAENADTPARRIYYALQCAYIGAEHERAVGLMNARQIAAALRPVVPPTAREMLDDALAAAEADNLYQALKFVRRLIQQEDLAIGGGTHGIAP